MKVEDYESLPDGISKTKLESVINVFFQELNKDPKEIAIEKLDVISDFQWHTYELPSSEVQEKVEQFLLNYWEDTQEYAEFVMGIVYCFGLSRKLFLRAFNNYGDKDDFEFLGMLNNSNGEYIDPYWSLRKESGASEDI